MAKRAIGENPFVIIVISSNGRGMPMASSPCRYPAAPIFNNSAALGCVRQGCRPAAAGTGETGFLTDGGVRDAPAMRRSAVRIRDSLFDLCPSWTFSHRNITGRRSLCDVNLERTSGIY
ncbi:MAG: hypothetical protein F8N15_10305 [Methanobacterium sp.]|nr:hypothetical protein [Methanobacterium sp.]